MEKSRQTVMEFDEKIDGVGATSTRDFATVVETAQIQALHESNKEIRKDLEIGHIGVRLLVENVLDYAIILLDLEGHVLTWNKGAELLNGYSASEIIGRHFSIFFLPTTLKPVNRLTNY